jgi:hypothetical protein
VEELVQVGHGGGFLLTVLWLWFVLPLMLSYINQSTNGIMSCTKDSEGEDERRRE